MQKRSGTPKGLTYFRKGGAASKSQKVVKYAQRVKHGQNVLLIHTQAHMQTLPHQNIAKTLITPRRPRAVKERVSNGGA